MREQCKSSCKIYQKVIMHTRIIFLFYMFFFVSSCDYDVYTPEDCNSVKDPVFELEPATDIVTLSSSQNKLLVNERERFLHIWDWDIIKKEPIKVALEKWVSPEDTGIRGQLPMNRVCALKDSLKLVQASYENNDTSIIAMDIREESPIKRWSLGRRWECIRARNCQNGKYVAILLDEKFGFAYDEKYEGSREDYGRVRLGVISQINKEVLWASTIYRYSFRPEFNNIAVSEDGKYLVAVGADNGGFIHMADVKEKKVLWEKVPHGDEVPHGIWTVNFNDVCFSPDSKYVYVAGNVGLFCFDVQTGKILTQWQIDSRFITVAVSADGSLVAGGEQPGGLVYIYKAKTGKLILKLLTGQYSIYGLAFSPDSKLLATSGVKNTNIKIWEMPSYERDHENKQ